MFHFCVLVGHTFIPALGNCKGRRLELERTPKQRGGNLPDDVLIQGRIGVEFPDQIPILSWSCGLKTVSAMGDEQVCMQPRKLSFVLITSLRMIKQFGQWLRLGMPQSQGQMGHAPW